MSSVLTIRLSTDFAILVLTLRLQVLISLYKYI